MSDLEHEFAATLHARQELGRELEPQLVERFVDKLEAEIDKRVDEKLKAAQRPRRKGSITPMVLGSLGTGVAATAVANGMGAAGIVVAIVAWLAIAAVNYLWAVRG
ncbi:MAG: hypothetical protein ACYDA3_11810 [Gaiellaceae bacterium]